MIRPGNIAQGKNIGLAYIGLWASSVTLQIINRRQAEKMGKPTEKKRKYTGKLNEIKNILDNILF